MGSEREAGGVREILVTAPLFFPTVPSRGWSKLGQEAVVRPTGRCLNLWVLIEPGSVYLPLSHHSPGLDKSRFNCVSGADRQQIGLLFFIFYDCRKLHNSVITG